MNAEQVLEGLVRHYVPKPCILKSLTYEISGVRDAETRRFGLQSLTSTSTVNSHNLGKSKYMNTEPVRSEIDRLLDQMPQENWEEVLGKPETHVMFNNPHRWGRCPQTPQLSKPSLGRRRLVPRFALLPSGGLLRP